MTSTIIGAIITLIGIALVLAGVAMIYTPLTLIAGGALLVHLGRSVAAGASA